MIERITDC